MTKNQILARAIVNVIMADLTSRKGFDHLFEELDEDIQWELEESWRKLVIECLS